jgi:hypothetical protein
MASETIFCPACNNKLRVPDDLMGQEVQCPKCQRMFTAPPPPTSIRPTDHPEVPPRRFPVQPTGGFDEDEDRWDVERRRQPGPNPMPPGIFLMVAAILGILISGFRVVMAVGFPDQLRKFAANGPFGGGMPPGLDIVTVTLVTGIIFLLLSLTSAAGAMSMIGRKMWWLAILGCFTAIFNIGDLCCLLGAPAGIWGLIVLFNENTRRTFQ